MTDFLKKMAGMALPFWMSKGEPGKLLAVMRRFWAEVYGWITWPVNQFDPLVCPEPLLRLLAYDRDITRFDGEPLELFRRRVAYAFVNASDAGSVAGFIAIFERLGIGYVELVERQPGIDWDIITVRVSDSQLAANSELMIQIIRQYGRTCRRYQYEVLTTLKLFINAGWDDGELICYSARESVSGTDREYGEYVTFPAVSQNENNAVFGAKL
ncbi:phage tail protein [Kluyvera intermedia]|uniref:phage tail protein n=1 Tax=Kluyvera intermedia TaxID=61648 RepID=UPI001F3B9A4E|nr:phage tail protein [Kluyvera intermedia]MCE9890911.1 phage tail protein [Kluyvera intermedia]